MEGTTGTPPPLHHFPPAPPGKDAETAVAFSSRPFPQLLSRGRTKETSKQKRRAMLTAEDWAAAAELIRAELRHSSLQKELSGDEGREKKAFGDEENETKLLLELGVLSGESWEPLF